MWVKCTSIGMSTNLSTEENSHETFPVSDHSIAAIDAGLSNSIGHGTPNFRACANGNAPANTHAAAYGNRNAEAHIHTGQNGDRSRRIHCCSSDRPGRTGRAAGRHGHSLPEWSPGMAAGK